MFARFSLPVIVAAGMYLARATPLISRAPVCARSYTITSGDICLTISAANKVSTYQLQLNNPAINAQCDNLFIGETLCLGYEGQDCTDVHMVAEGDTCFAISVAENITYDTLLANNPNINADCTNIYPDEVLCVASEPVYTSS